MPPAPTTQAVFPLQQQRPIGARVKGPGGAIDDRAVQALGEMENAGDRVFGHRQRVAGAARGRHGHVAAPQIAEQQVARPGRALVKPFQPPGAGAQIERERPAPENDLCFGEQPVAFLARALPVLLRGT